MSVNRYTEFNPQQYVSTYVPLPLEYIDQVGAMKQADLDKHKKAIEDDTDPLSKIGNLSTVLKTYDGKGNIVDTEYNQLEDYRQQSLQNLSTEREKLSSDLAMGKITDEEFKQKSASHIKNATNVYNQLQGYKTEVDKINKYNEEFSKNKAYAQDPYYAQRALAYNTEFMKKGDVRNFAGVDIADTFDFQDAVKNFTFKDEGNQTVSLGDYIFKSGDKGVTKDRVQYAASQIFNNPTSKINQYVNMSVDHYLSLYGLTGNETEYPDGNKITIEKVEKDKDGKLITKEIPVSYRQKLMAEQAESFIKSAETEHAGMIHNESASANPFAIQKRSFDRTDNMIAPYSETGPGPEQVGIETLKSNPAYANYVNENGTINWTALFDESKGNPSTFTDGLLDGVYKMFDSVSGSLGIIPGMPMSNLSGKTKTERIKAAEAFEKQMRDNVTNIAKTIGYDKPITVSNYDDILTKGEEFSKVHGMAINTKDAERTVLSDRLNTGKQSYTYFDPNTGSEVEDKEGKILDPKVKFTVLQRTTRVTDGKARESVLKVQDQSGNIYYARPTDSESNNYYDAVFETQNSSLEYNRQSKKEVINNAGVSKDKVNETVTKLFNQSGLPLDFNIKTINTDPRDKNQIYVTIKSGNEDLMLLMNKGTMQPLTSNFDGQDKLFLAPNEYLQLKNKQYNLSRNSGALRKASGVYKEESVIETGSNTEDDDQ
jgi:hypothetical protein